MHLPSRTSLRLLMFFIIGCSILLSWIVGFSTLENATFRDWQVLIASIIGVAFALGYFIFKRFRSSFMVILAIFIVACSILLSWVAGFLTPENATLQDWNELIASIATVAFILGYFIFKRFRSSIAS